ncbi:MAG: endolytic transglycosylase MltG [Endomicrobium sp.]|jgi:UPF0755 protein|nr:endolytic transglycosylase MltG [Endomicrobium sp.]
MVKNAAYKIIIALIIISAAAVAARHFYLPDEKMPISVKNGETARSVSLKLKEKNLILSANLFLCWVKASGAASKIKAGYYEFSSKDGMFKILSELKNGSSSLVKFTVPEGSSIKQTAEIVAQKVFIDKDAFIKTAQDLKAEGYLMPETYYVDPTSTQEQIIALMQAEFDKKVTPEMRARAGEIGVSLQDVVIIASIVEKEAVNPKERPVIAAVFYNRLKKKIRLESCATVLYAMGVSKARLTLEDTKFDSPYNTYRHAGLPPGPICSPGIESIKAALYPANTGSLFFVSQGNGSHLFAADLQEHVQNKRITKKNIKRRQAASGDDKNNR